MNLYVVFALCATTATAFDIPATVTGVDAAEIQQVIDSIYHPSTDPATADALEEMLLEILGISKPVIVEELATIPVDDTPEIIDDTIILEFGHNDELTPNVNPVNIDEPIVSEPANNRPPLDEVDGHINRNDPRNTIVVEQPDQHDSIIKPEDEEITVAQKPQIDKVLVAPLIVN